MATMRYLGRQPGLVLTLAICLGLVDPAAAQTCPGDCNGDSSVAIAELIRGVNIALGRIAVDACPAADRGGDGAVSISDLIAAVNAALFGCQPSSPTPTARTTNAPSTTPTTVGTVTAMPSPTGPSGPTATGIPTPAATATPIGVAPPGIFIHPNSLFQHVVTTAEIISVNVFVAVDRLAEETATVTLDGPSGSTPLRLTGISDLGNQPYAFYFAGSPLASLSYQPGASYKLSVVTSIGTAMLDFTAVGGITIPADGSQVSWAYDGDGERVLVFSPAQSTAYDSRLSNKTSPFAIPTSAYGSGPGTYRITGEVQRNFQSFAGAAAGSAFTLSTSLSTQVEPSVVGNANQLAQPIPIPVSPLAPPNPYHPLPPPTPTTQSPPPTTQPVPGTLPP